MIANRYELLGLLGEGGMSTVYRVQDRRLRRQAALKLIRREIFDVDGRARFVGEAEALARIRHPSVVHLLDFGEADDRLFLVMELVQGRSLRERLLSGRLPVDETVRVMHDLLGGLDAIHAAGMVHRDITPSNIIVRDEGPAAFIDFGLARPEGAGHTVTAPGCRVGTPRYMPPEVARGERWTPAGDLFALAFVGGEALSGVDFHGLSNEPPRDGIALVLSSLLSGAYHGVAMRALATHGAAGRWLGRPLMPDPARRPSSAADMLRAFPADAPAARPPDSRTASAVSASPKLDAPRAPRSVPALTDPLLSRLQPFKVVRLIGEGGMGVVYEARHARTGERVAVKVIRRDARVDQAAMQRFKREIALMGSVNSPHVVRLLDSGCVEDERFLVMEFLEGESLSDRLQRGGPLYFADSVRLLCDVSGGVADLHGRGVVHRDLKPANIFLTERTGARILDLGIAKDLSATELTATGHIPGTLLYLAQLRQVGRGLGPETRI